MLLPLTMQTDIASPGPASTVAQANVIFTLGNTDGMTCKDIGDWTHITKGTLTGVIDRLELKGLVERWGGRRRWP